jgi:hypothetical protein
MRAYFFGNMYLSSIQQGIQAAHVVHELFMKPHNEEGNMYLFEWATNHKTMILLNAGYSEEIRRLVEFFDTPENPFPWASFNEGQDALDGALTCVGIVIPERVYELASAMREHGSGRAYKYGDEPANEVTRLWEAITQWEQFLAERLNEYGLAK